MNMFKASIGFFLGIFVACHDRRMGCQMVTAKRHDVVTVSGWHSSEQRICETVPSCLVSWLGHRWTSATLRIAACHPPQSFWKTMAMDTQGWQDSGWTLKYDPSCRELLDFSLCFFLLQLEMRLNTKWQHWHFVGPGWDFNLWTFECPALCGSAQFKHQIPPPKWWATSKATPKCQPTRFQD